MPRLPDPITHRSYASLGVLLLWASVVGVASVAYGATPDRCHSDSACRALTESGMKKVQAFDYETGLKDFQAAYARRPEPRLLINIGRCYFRMSRPEEALTYYRRFQSASGFTPEPELAQALKQYIAEAEAAIAAKPKGPLPARLVLSVSAPGDILIDEKRVASGPLVRSFELTAGTHRVQYIGAAAEGKELLLEAGKEVALSLGPVATAPSATADQRLPRPRWRLASGGVALGIGALLIGVGAGALAVDGRCTTTTENGLCGAAFDENGIRMASIYDSRGAGIGMLVPGIALVATGAVLLALPGPRREKPALSAAR